MDIRVLYGVAVIVAAISGGLYYYSGKAQRLESDGAHSMIYSAKNIHLIQTNDQGNLYIRADVDTLEQDIQKKTSELENLRATMYQQGQVDATFQSDVARGYNDNEKVILSGNVIANKKSEQGDIHFTTDELTAYPKTKQVETTHQINVVSPSSSFTSKGLKANLENEHYQFFNIRGTYAPRS